jgi:hypothetical protein
MRFILGIIIGVLLTVGGAYVADAVAGTEAKPMVNWDVVVRNVNALTDLARAGWKRIAGWFIGVRREAKASRRKWSTTAIGAGAGP